MNKPFVWPPVLTDEELAERRRLAALLAAGCAVLYLAVLVVRLAWGQS